MTAGVAVSAMVAWTAQAMTSLDSAGIRESNAYSLESRVGSHWQLRVWQNSALILLSSSWADNDASFFASGSLGADTDPSALIPTWAPWAQPGSEESQSSLHQVYGSGAGWPLLCLYGYVKIRTREAESGRVVSVRTIAGFPLHPVDPIGASRPRAMRLITYAPIWFGLTINSIFYSLLLSVVWVFTRYISKCRRAARGCCSNCGHFVSRSGFCTECGNRAPSSQGPS